MGVEHQPDMGVSKNRDTPKWMVKNNGKAYVVMDDLGENPLFSETSTYIYIYIYTPETQICIIFEASFKACGDRYRSIGT